MILTCFFLIVMVVLRESQSQFIASNLKMLSAYYVAYSNINLLYTIALNTLKSFKITNFNLNFNVYVWLSLCVI